MGILISLLIIFTILFLVFMFSIDGIDDLAKTVSLVIGVVLIAIIIFQVVRG